MITINEIYDHFLIHPEISTDTRNIKQGAIFFALRGENFNGNKFADMAVRNGASMAIVDEYEISNPEKKIFYVEDTLKSLQELAVMHRRKFSIPVLGITGTNGKTTTKELIGSVLSKKYRIIATQGNYNNHIGVPLTILRITNNTQFAIIEMGANHIGEIASLCKISDPDYGIITNIGMAHLEGFGSFEGVIKAKGELYKYILHKDGKIFVNSGDEVLNKISTLNTSIIYGVGSNISGRIIDIDPTLKMEIYYENENIKNSIIINSLLAGKYNLDNILAAFAIGKYFEVPADQIKIAIESYQPGNIRSQIKITDKNKLIIDAYNANLTSMQKALENFHEIKDQNKFLILGDMFELGKYSEQAHKEILNLVDTLGFKNYFLVGKEFINVSKMNINNTFLQVSDLIEFIKEHPLKDKTILIKGSRGVGLERVIDYL